MSALRVYAFACDEPGCREVVSTTETSATAARKVASRRGWSTTRTPSPDGFYFWRDRCPSHSEERVIPAA
jgi:hypothetical protein